MRQRARYVIVIVSGLLLGGSVMAGSASAQGVRERQPGWQFGGSPPAPPAFVPAPMAPRPSLAPRPRPPDPPRQHPFGRGPSRSSAVGYPVFVPVPVSPGYPELYDPAALYGPPAGMEVVTPTLAAPPAPTSIEHRGGRYELRGDGVATPHVWVWLPDPPSAPPGGPPAAAPVPPMALAPPESTEIYRFTDEQGVVNWTDRWDSIPERYRAQAKRLPL
jgi:hypothetical protein